MWILTRNENEGLKRDGTWSFWRYTTQDEEMLFDSFEAAKSYAEAQGIGEFTRPLHLRTVYQERFENIRKSVQRVVENRAGAEHVALPEPLEFHAISQDYDVPTFDSFVVTHYVISGGNVFGVLGYGKDDDSYHPFCSIVGDDFDLAFGEVYRLSRNVDPSTEEPVQSPEQIA